MKDLFYTETDKTLFWVSGYDVAQNDATVIKFTKSILSDAKKFAKVAGCELSKVKSTVVEKSRRYKYMRVFYVDAEFTKESAPSGCYFIAIKTEADRHTAHSLEQLQWNMWKWLTD